MSTRQAILGLGLLIAIYIATADHAARSLAPTSDEYWLLDVASTYPDFSTHDSIRHPPLAAALQSLFVDENSPDDPDQAIVAPRRAMLIFGVLLGVYAFAFAHRSGSRSRALAASALVLFCPSILGHSPLLTTDVPAAACLLITLFHAWRWRETRSFLHVLATGLALGLALGAKHLTLPLAPLLLAYVWSARIKHPRTYLDLFIATLLALGVLSALYGFKEFPTTDLSSLALKSPFLAEVPLGIPLPVPYVYGLDNAMDLSRIGFPHYFAGTFQQHAPWWQFPLAIAIKMPLLPVLLILVGLGWALFDLCRRRLGSADALLLSTAFFWIAVISSSGLFVGPRHLLPAYPPLFLLASRCFGSCVANKGRVALAILFGVHIAGVLIGSPHHLSTFNEWLGGRQGGHRYLLDSALDWGQCQYEVEEIGRRAAAASAPLRTDPSWIPTEGPRLIKAMVLHDFPGTETRFDWLRELDPVRDIAGAWFVYEPSLESVRTARQERPRSVPLMWAEAGFLYQSRDKDIESERLLQEILKLDPDHSRAAELLGLIHARTGRLEEAVKAFESIAVKDPKSYRSRLALAALARDRGDRAAMNSLLREATAARVRASHVGPKAEQGSADESLNLSFHAWVKGDFQAASSHLDRARELDPQLSDVHGNRARIAFDLGHFDEADRERARYLESRKARASRFTRRLSYPASGQFRIYDRGWILPIPSAEATALARAAARSSIDRDTARLFIQSPWSSLETDIAVMFFGLAPLSR